MRKLLLGIAAVAMIACGGGDSTGPSANVAGTWNLKTINNSQLPYTAIFIASPVYKLEVMSDNLVTNADGTYVETATIRETDGTTVNTQTSQDAGTWSQNGNTITVTASDGSTANATISGNTITLNADGDILVYQRQ